MLANNSIYLGIKIKTWYNEDFLMSQNTSILHCTISFRCTLQSPFFLQPFHTQWFTNCLWRKNLNLLFFFVILTFWGKCNLFNSNRKNPNNKCHTFNRNTRVLGAKIKTDFYQLDWKSQRIWTTVILSNNQKKKNIIQDDYKNLKLSF